MTAFICLVIGILMGILIATCSLLFMDYRRMVDYEKAINELKEALYYAKKSAREAD